jgi:hypothetical protein
VEPSHWEAHVKLADLLRVTGDGAAARAHYGRALALQPRHSESRRELELALEDLEALGER